MTNVSATASTTIPSYGLLDVSSLVNQVLSGQQQPINGLEQQQSQYQTQLSDFSVLQNLASNLQESLSPLSNLTGSTSQVTGQVQQFVSDYNQLSNALNADEANGIDSNSALQSIKNQLSSAAGAVTSGLGSYSSLAQIGITTAPAQTLTSSNGTQYISSGQLSLNSTTLQNALNTDFNGVAQLFGDNTQGIATQLNSTIQNINSPNGVISSNTSLLNQQIAGVGTEISNAQANLALTSNSYLQQFSNLNTTLTQLQLTNSYLTQVFAALPTSNDTSSSDLPTLSLNSSGLPTLASDSTDSFGLPTLDSSSTDSFGLPTLDSSSTDSFGLPTFDSSSTDSFGLSTSDSSSTDSFGLPSLDSISADSFGLSTPDSSNTSSGSAIDNNTSDIAKL